MLHHRIIDTVGNPKIGEISMLGFGLKKRTAEAIRRGVRASLTGAFFHRTRVQEFGLNDEGSAWLFTEAYAHQFYVLGCITTHACKNERWATFEFFAKSAVDGIRESERTGGMNTEQLTPILLKRYSDFEALGSEARLRGEHYRSSAILVAERDESADIESITRALSSSTERYMVEAGKMFGI